MRAEYIRRMFLTACLSSTLLMHTLNPAHAANYIFSPSPHSPSKGFGEPWFDNKTKKAVEEELEAQKNPEAQKRQKTISRAETARYYNELREILPNRQEKKSLLTLLKMGVHRWTKEDFSDFFQDSANVKPLERASSVLKDEGATIEEKLIEDNEENKLALYQLNSDTYRALYHKTSQEIAEQHKQVFLNVLQEFYGSERFLDKKLLKIINEKVKIHICEPPDKDKGFDTGNSPHILAVRDVIERYIPCIRSDVFSYMDDLIPEEKEREKLDIEIKKEEIAQWLDDSLASVTGKDAEKKANKASLQKKKTEKNDEHKFHIINRSYEWDKHREGETKLAQLKDSINDMKGTIQLIDALTHLDEKGVLVINAFGNEMKNNEKRMEFFDIGKFPTLDSDNNMRKVLNSFLLNYEDKNEKQIKDLLEGMKYNDHLHKQFPTKNVVAVTNLSNENIIDETSFRPDMAVYEREKDESQKATQKSPISETVELGKGADTKYMESLQRMTVSAIGSVFVYRPFSPWTWENSGGQKKKQHADKDKVFAEIAGTSFSAPKVTAMIVLLRAIFSSVIPFKGADGEMEVEGDEKRPPKNDVLFFKDIVLQSALREGRSPETYGQGLLNFRRALIYGLAVVKGNPKEVDGLREKAIELLTRKNQEETKEIFDKIKTLSKEIDGKNKGEQEKDLDQIHKLLNDIIKEIDALDQKDFEQAHQKKTTHEPPSHKGSSDGGEDGHKKKTKPNDENNEKINSEE